MRIYGLKTYLDGQSDKTSKYISDKPSSVSCHMFQ